MTKRICIYKWETNYDTRVVMLEGVCWLETLWKHWSNIDNIIKYFYNIYKWDQWVESKSVVNEVKLTYENFSTIRDKCLLISQSSALLTLITHLEENFSSCIKKAYFPDTEPQNFWNENDSSLSTLLITLLWKQLDTSVLLDFHIISKRNIILHRNDIIILTNLTCDILLWKKS